MCSPKAHLITKINILQHQDSFIIYEPRSGTKLGETVLKSLAERWSEGFLDGLKPYFYRWRPPLPLLESDIEIEAYRSGIDKAEQVCRCHIEKGGEFVSPFLTEVDLCTD